MGSPNLFTKLLSLQLAGEEPQTGIIAGIAPGKATLITCVEDDRLGFQVISFAIYRNNGRDFRLVTSNYGLVSQELKLLFIFSLKLLPNLNPYF